MFDLSWGKLVVIGVIALLVIGPKELPSVLRQVGLWMGKMRRMAAEFQGQFQEAMREAEMADLKKQFDETTESFKSALDPTSIKTDLEKMIEDPVKPADGTTPADPASATTAPTDPAALGTGPATPPAEPAVNIDVPMPELPPPVTEADILPKPDATPRPAAEAEPRPAAEAEGGKAA